MRRAGKRSHIRWMIRRDMPQVLEIETRSFSQAWKEDDFLRCLRQRNCIGMVAERGEDVVGFMVYELHAREIRLLNFAVHTDLRRQKIGRDLVEKLKSKLSSHRRSKISLVLRESNLPAQLFFRSADFRAIRILTGYYTDTLEDGYLMEYSLDEHQVT
jgi:[ribosomal protein S18]-alanine N-acetyltransferase